MFGVAPPGGFMLPMSATILYLLDRVESIAIIRVVSSSRLFIPSARTSSTTKSHTLLRYTSAPSAIGAALNVQHRVAWRILSGDVSHLTPASDALAAAASGSPESSCRSDSPAKPLCSPVPDSPELAPPAAAAMDSRA